MGVDYKIPTNTKAEAERIWLATVAKIQQTDQRFTDIKKLTPDPKDYKVELSSAANKEIIKDFDPILAALKPSMDAWIAQNATKKWAFWSGRPAQAVATNAPGWNALESSAIGKLFDGLNINGKWNTQLWGALSNAYAEALANNVGKAAGFGGFVGLESRGVENIYKQVEDKAVVRILGSKKAASLDFTWYSCISDKNDEYKADTSQKVDGIPGTFFKSKNREEAITKAEEANRTLHGKGDAPHGNLLEHLQANKDASAAFDGNLMSKLKTSTAPKDPKLKGPDMLPWLFHQRPTLQTLFENSTVATSLQKDLQTIQVKVKVGAQEEERHFLANSPWTGQLKKAVGAELAGSVRQPTILTSVLQRPAPTIPSSAKGAIRKWLESQGGSGKSEEVAAEDKKPGDPKLLPKEPFTNADGEKHHVVVVAKGKQGVVEQHSTPKRIKDLAQKGTFKLAEDIETLTTKYLETGEGLADIRKHVAALTHAMKVSRGESEGSANVDVVKKRLALEKELGKTAMKHGSSMKAADHLGNQAWKLIEAEYKPLAAAAKQLDKDVLTDSQLMAYGPFQDKLKSLGMDLKSGYFGAVGKNVDDIKEALIGSGNLREKVQHVINWGNQWAEKVFTTEPAALAKLMKDAGVLDTKIPEILALKAKVESTPKGKTKAKVAPNKALMGDASNNPDFVDAKGQDMDKKFPRVPLQALDDKQLALLAERLGLLVDRQGDAIKDREGLITQIIEKQKAAHEKAVAKAGANSDPDFQYGLDGKAKAKGQDVGTSTSGEPNPMTQATRDKDDPDVQLSEREKQAQGLDEEVLPFLEGMTANMITMNSKWVQAARRMGMPLRAGISGTTQRFMNLATQLGADAYGARMAMLGHLIPTNAHSFHEIMVASQGFGPTYKPGRYIPLQPLAPDQVREIAKKAGAKDAAEVDAILGTGGNA